MIVGISIEKTRIHHLTGISRATIDRILTKGNPMTTTDLHGYGSYTLSASPEADIAEFVDEFSDDFDLDAIAGAYRAAINAALEDDGIWITGDGFVANYPAPKDATDLIKVAIASVDLGSICEKHDHTLA